MFQLEHFKIHCFFKYDVLLQKKGREMVSFREACGEMAFFSVFERRNGLFYGF